MLHNIAISACQCAPTGLAPKYHWDNRPSNGETQHPARDKHILYAVALDPWRDREWNCNTHRVAYERHSGESITSDLQVDVSKNRSLETK